MDNCKNNNEMLKNVPTVKENGVKKRQRRILIHSNLAANSKRNDLRGNIQMYKPKLLYNSSIYTPILSYQVVHFYATEIF